MRKWNFDTLLYGTWRCDNCGEPHPRYKRIWKNSAFPYYEFGSKKCMIEYERKDKDEMRSHEPTKNEPDILSKTQNVPEKYKFSWEDIANPLFWIFILIFAFITVLGLWGPIIIIYGIWWVLKNIWTAT
jgi:hypothetical protein|tara:strand:- start:19 stop:405 length:387 start_codon:yes stop_codon:yes gene_type:complete